MSQPRAPPKRWCKYADTNRTITHRQQRKGSTPGQVCCPLCFLPSGRERSNHMIPDEPFNFNHFGALTNFDDHDVRMRHRLRQDTMSTREADRHLLFVCPVCKRPWYKAGSCEYPRLTAEQLAELGAALHTDVHTLHLFPKALCPICSTIYLGGMFSVGEYPHHRGYHFLWESASPRRIRLLAMVCRSEGITMDLLVQMSPTTRTEPRCNMRAVLAWLETCPFPETTGRLLFPAGWSVW